MNAGQCAYLVMSRYEYVIYLFGKSVPLVGLLHHLSACGSIELRPMHRLLAFHLADYFAIPKSCITHWPSAAYYRRTYVSIT